MGKRKAYLNYTIEPDWGIVQRIRSYVEKALEAYDQDLIDATKMTTSELLKNAVKHTSGKLEGIFYEIKADKDHIFMTTGNRIFDPEDLRVFKEHIEKIKVADPQQLYMNRLMELMENPDDKKTRLGLFRIAYEGEFEIDYQYDDQWLTITASRKLT